MTVRSDRPPPYADRRQHADGAGGVGGDEAGPAQDLHGRDDSRLQVLPLEARLAFSMEASRGRGGGVTVLCGGSGPGPEHDTRNFLSKIYS